MSPRKRPAPRQGNRPSRTTTSSAESSLHRAEDGYQAPTAEERAVHAAMELLHEHGYGIAGRCLDCRHPISSLASLARMRGPRCEARARAVAE